MPYIAHSHRARVSRATPDVARHLHAHREFRHQCRAVNGPGILLIACCSWRASTAWRASCLNAVTLSICRAGGLGGGSKPLYVRRPRPWWRAAPGTGRRAGQIGSLLMAVHSDTGELTYIGNVGTGFTQATLTDLHARLQPLQRNTVTVDASVPDVVWG